MDYIPNSSTEPRGGDQPDGSSDSGAPSNGSSPKNKTSAVPGSPKNGRRAPQPLAADFFYTLFWLLCCAAFVVGLWHLGPLVAERYQFALSRGKARAEYFNATEILSKEPLAGLSIASELVAQRIRPSVVSIECEKVVGKVEGRLGFSGGQGSGVIVRSDGMILTNAHVVSGARIVRVTLPDHRQLDAQIIGIDASNDLAMLKVEANDLIPADWGDSENLRVGSLVWAVGSPYGLEQTVTSGIVSGKNRYGQDPNSGNNPYQELIQTDAAVNKGNSGGPLVDAHGKVIGINTSILGDQFQGISFAIPSSVAQFVATRLIANGEVDYGFLGILPEQVLQQFADSLGLPDLNGALVRSVTPNTPASRAGLRPGDVIRKWNDIPIENHKMVYRLVQTTEPGSVAKVDVFRGGISMEFQIEVTKKDSL